LFSVPFGLGFIFPLIRIQDSFVSDFAVLKFGSSFAVVIVWTVPVMSRTSRKISFPCSRIALTQPLISTSLFVDFWRSAINVLFIMAYVGLGL